MIRKIVTAIFSVIISTIAMGQRVTLNIPNGHAKNIEQLATSSDGKYIASIAFNTVMVWDVASRKKIHEINLNLNISKGSHIDPSLAITDNLDKVLVSADNHLYCYNIQTGKEILNETGFGSAILSKDGNKVYALNYRSLFIFDANTGNNIKFINGMVSADDAKVFELEDSRLLILHNSGWSIINLVTYEVVFNKVFENAYSEKLDGYDYSKKDNLIIGFRDEYLISFDVFTGATIKKKTPAANPSGLCINAKGELVLFSRDYKAKKYITELLKTTDFSLLKSSFQPDDEVPEPIFYATHCMPLPGTKKIIYNNDKQLYLFDTEDGSYTNPFQNKITDFKEFYYYSNLTERLLADNNLTFSTEDYGVRDFNMETFKPGKYIPASASVVMSPDGKLAAGIGNKITLTSLATGKLIKILPLPSGIDPKLEFFFFNYDNTKLIYTEKFKGSINAIDINTGIASKIVALGAFFGEESASYDGKYFACDSYETKAGTGNYIKVYNLQTKQVVLTKKADNIHGLQFLNDSYYLFAHMRNISIFKADDPAFVSSFTLENLNGPIVMGGDIKNNIIAIGEGDRISIYKIWLITLQGKVLKTFQSENKNDFLKAAFSKDDKIMFTPTIQKGIQVWNTESSEMLGTYYFIKKTNEYIFVSPEGLFDGSIEGMKELYFVKNNKPIPLEKLYEKFYTPDLLRRKINGEKFLPPDVANLHDAPKVSIAYAAAQRNMEVTNDIPTYRNATGAAEITVTASAPQDAVDEIRLFHNGKIVTLVTRNLTVEDDKSASAIKKYTINLLPGENNIRAVSLNTQRTESDPDEIAVVYNADNTNGNVIKSVINNTGGAPVAAVDKDATLHLIVVGINDYQNKSMSLNYAMADATSFKEELEKDAKTIIANVKTYFVSNNSADKTGITNTFKQVQQDAKAQDVFIFYYAGHGVIGKDKEFYLVPTDVSDLKNVQTELEQKGIASKMLQQYAIDIQAQKQLFILDACQSAGAFEKLLSNDGDQQKSLAVVARSTGTHWMAASGAMQYANEFSSLGHGVFTYALLLALKGEAANNKMITVNGLKNFLQIQVPLLMKKYNGAAQYPASYGFGSDFPVELIK